MTDFSFFFFSPQNRTLQSKFFEAYYFQFQSVSSFAQSCPTLCDPMNRSMPGLPVHHQLPESTQTHVHCVSDAIQPSHPLSFLSPPALNLSQHQVFSNESALHQHLSATSFAPVSHFISNCKALGQPL